MATVRGFVVGLVVAGVIVVAMSIWSGRPTSQVPAYQATDREPPAAIIVPTPAPSAIASTGCDETEELMARMFVGLTQAVLTESGTEPEAFASALVADREIWRRYLEVLGIPVDDAWLDAFMDAGLDQRLVARCLHP